MIELVDVPFGTRFVGYWNKGIGNQYPVRTYDEVREIVKEHLAQDNLGISMCTYNNGLPYLLFLPFDFDAENLRDAWNDAKKLYNILIDKGYTVCLTYSGRKGFHIFVKTVPKLYPKKLIKAVQVYFKEMFNLNTMDEQIFGDVRRLMRIPHTYNMKGDLCRILTEDRGKDLDLNELIDINKLSNISVSYEPDDEYELRDYPCIEQLIQDREYWKKNHPRGDFEPAQPIRYTWAAIRLIQGYSEDEIIEEAEGYDWDDYEEDKTRYQIRHISGKGYIPHSCNSLREMGFCVVKNCRYKKVDKWFLKEMGIRN